MYLFQAFNYCFYFFEYWQVEAGRWVGYDKVTKVTTWSWTENCISCNHSDAKALRR